MGGRPTAPIHHATLYEDSTKSYNTVGTNAHTNFSEGRALICRSRQLKAVQNPNDVVTPPASAASTAPGAILAASQVRLQLALNCILHRLHAAKLCRMGSCSLDPVNAVCCCVVMGVYGGGV